ncbi:MAG: phosphoadenosine phosphosulfate reductase family protein [Candidatus Lokiarchaeota archaeon]|nr:phosphoadenosine phosphosulfate reductase family protein [Candidatus Lokiarchaeota archaeon]
MAKAPYLGRLKLYWCKNDNIPILDHPICPKCKYETDKIQLTPPGDIRPAFENDLVRIRTTIDTTFGEGLGLLLIPKNNIYLINRTSGIDLSQEIIANGYVYGRFLYNVLRERFEFHPRQVGAKLLVYFADQNNIPLKHTVYLYEDSVPFIKEGKSILAPGIKRFDLGIEEGDFCIICYENEYISLGIAYSNGTTITEMVEKGYGKVAKNLRNQRSTIPLDEIIDSLKPRSWEQVYEANEDHMQFVVKEAQRFIRNTISHHSNINMTAVAYSGGKDSLCTLLLVYDTMGPKFEIFFADTGIELPETIENTLQVAKALGMQENVHINCANDKIWDLIEHLGPPARDYRFCCHGLKAQRINEIIDSVSSGEKVLSFLGQRRYESFSRAAEKRVYVNSFIPQQIAATPIKNWNALEVWLYILYYPHLVDGMRIDIPVNQLYFQEFERIGCYLCPASDLATLRILRDIHPQLMDKWDSWLKTYAKKYNLPNEWIKYGLWRFHHLDTQWKKYFEKHKIDYSSFGFDSPSVLRINKENSKYSDQTTILGEIFLPIDFRSLKPLLSVLTGTKHLKNDILQIHNHQFEFQLTQEGNFSIKSTRKKKDIEKFLHHLAGLILKSQNCANCGVCEDICPQNIICVKKKGTKYIPTINTTKNSPCIHCLKCITHCPLYQKTKGIELNQ